MFKLAVLLLQITASVIRYLEERKLINEGERRQLAREMAKTAALAQMSKQVREEIGKMTNAEVDDALRGDFRD